VIFARLLGQEGVLLCQYSLWRQRVLGEGVVGICTVDLGVVFFFRFCAFARASLASICANLSRNISVGKRHSSVDGTFIIFIRFTCDFVFCGKAISKGTWTCRDPTRSSRRRIRENDFPWRRPGCALADE
jgi:hypothetical protein